MISKAKLSRILGAIEKEMLDCDSSIKRAGDCYLDSRETVASVVAHHRAVRHVLKRILKAAEPQEPEGK